MSDEGFNFLVVLALIAVFLLLSGLALWLLGLVPLWKALLAGFGGLLGLNLAWVLVSSIINAFVRLEPTEVWVFGLNLVLTFCLVFGWNFYLVEAIQGQGFSGFTSVAAYLLGLLPSYLGIVLVGSFFFGTLYQVAGLVVGIMSYIILVLVGVFS